MSDYMAWADDTAEKMRAYYEANKPLRWWQRRRVWNDYRADDLMLGLLNVALNSFAKRDPDPRVLEPYHLGPKRDGRAVSGIEELRQKLRMIVSHATGGASSDIDASVNDICVRISAHRNEVYEAGKAATPSAIINGYELRQAEIQASWDRGDRTVSDVELAGAVLEAAGVKLTEEAWAARKAEQEKHETLDPSLNQDSSNG